MTRKKKGEEKEHGGSERWLVTYSDLITLLLVFFIILYSMSSVNAKKYEQLSSSLKQTIAGDATGQFVGDSPGPAVVPGVAAAQREQNNMETAKQQLEKYIKEQMLEGKIQVSIDERGLVISIKDVLLFDSGSADLKPDAAEAVVAIGQNIASMPNSIRVEGHTDNNPIHTIAFPSNWDLSSKRAVNVLEVLTTDAGINPARLSATGYGEYQPLVPNNSDINRALNRRVDVVILKHALIGNENYEKGFRMQTRNPLVNL